MKERGYFDKWKDTRNVRYSPIIERLPWNPEARSRIVAFCVEQFEDGHWLNGNYRVRSPKGRHYIKGVWVNDGWSEIARVQVPHWDYDGQSWEARETWERADTDQQLDVAAEHRKWAEQSRLWDMEREILAAEGREQWQDHLAEAAD